MTDRPLRHRDWMALATEEYRRLDDLLGELDESEWAMPTDCAGWTVREVVAHLAGAAAATASVREQLRQQRLGRAEKGERLQIDAVNDIQVRERAGRSASQLRSELHEAAARSVRARQRAPGPVRSLRFPFPAPVGVASLGFLNDVVYTRDAWMHRLDICHATGHEPVLTADHDGRIVADAAGAWLRAAGRSEVTLTGPLGCVVSGHAGDEAPASYDAVAFARALSGRGELPGVRADLVLF